MRDQSPGGRGHAEQAAQENALGDILTPALRTLLPHLEVRDDIGCVMITGAGNAFCSGGDVSEMGRAPAATTTPMSSHARVADLTERQRQLTGRLYQLSKPTVAALPGAAAGAGLSLALAYAASLANGPTATLSRMKQNLHAGLTQSLDNSFALEARHMIESGRDPEAREAIAAFKEKRAPVFHPDSHP